MRPMHVGCVRRDAPRRPAPPRTALAVAGLIARPPSRRPPPSHRSPPRSRWRARRAPALPPSTAVTSQPSALAARRGPTARRLDPAPWLPGVTDDEDRVADWRDV